MALYLLAQLTALLHLRLCSEVISVSVIVDSILQFNHT